MSKMLSFNIISNTTKEYNCRSAFYDLLGKRLHKEYQVIQILILDSQRLGSQIEQFLLTKLKS